MTDSRFNDRPFAIFFAIVGVLGILPALYGLLIAGLVAADDISDMVTRHGSDELVRLVVSLGFISVTIFGFWLLLQYLRRAWGCEASVSKAKLWRLAAVDNAIYLASTFGLIAVDFSAGWAGAASIFWFTLLFGLSAGAAVLAADEQRALSALAPRSVSPPN